MSTKDSKTDKPCTIHSVIVRCSSCTNCGYEAPNFGNPYHELWCRKDHWHGVENASELEETIECVDFNAR